MGDDGDLLLRNDYDSLLRVGMFFGEKNDTKRHFKWFTYKISRSILLYSVTGSNALKL